MGSLIPVIAAAVGGLIGTVASIGSAVVTMRMQEKRDREARRNDEIDAAQLALKKIGQQMVEHIVAPGWWPRVGWLRPPRDFAYDVVRMVPDDRATEQWTAAAQEVVTANSSLWRLWLWQFFKIGTRERTRMVERVMAAEAAMVAAAEHMRPGRHPRRSD